MSSAYLVLSVNKNISVSRIGIADTPIPSTRKLAKLAYPDCLDICSEVGNILNLNLKNLEKKFNKYKASDIPNSEFSGPF